MFILLMLLKKHYTVEGDDTLNRMYFHCGEYNNVKISNHRDLFPTKTKNSAFLFNLVFFHSLVTCEC